MAHLIDKDELVEEIERRITNIKGYCLREGHDARFDVVPEQLSHILAFVDTLEVKEVELDNNMTDINFEEEIDNFMYGTRNPERFPDSFQVRDEHTGLTVLDWKWYVNNPKHKIEFAKYFFELGLKARKPE